MTCRKRSSATAAAGVPSALNLTVAQIVPAESIRSPSRAAASTTEESATSGIFAAQTVAIYADDVYTRVIR